MIRLKSNSNNNESSVFSIGDVAKVTGISVFTLRMWERRYGFPESTKLPSGHRRYSAEEIARLKLVKVAVDAGEKAANTLCLSNDRLTDLAKKYSCLNTAKTGLSFTVEKIIEKGKSWDDEGIYHDLDAEWQALGPLGFISERCTNLLHQLGQGWENGQISIATEHFVSRILEKFLLEKWTSLNTQTGSRKLLLSSLEGEDHTFGLHFCAVATVASGAKVIDLGKSTPDQEIVAAAVGSNCSAVCISLSASYDFTIAIKKIKFLRKMLPADIDLIVGGAGAPADINGVLSMTNCQSLYDWLSSKWGDDDER